MSSLPTSHRLLCCVLPSLFSLMLGPYSQKGVVTSLRLGRVLNDCQLKEHRFTSSTEQPEKLHSAAKSQVPSSHPQQTPKNHRGFNLLSLALLIFVSFSLCVNGKPLSPKTWPRLCYFPATVFPVWQLGAVWGISAKDIMWNTNQQLWNHKPSSGFKYSRNSYSVTWMTEQCHLF